MIEELAEALGYGEDEVDVGGIRVPLFNSEEEFLINFDEEVILEILEELGATEEEILDIRTRIYSS